MKKIRKKFVKNEKIRKNCKEISMKSILNKFSLNKKEFL